MGRKRAWPERNHGDTGRTCELCNSLSTSTQLCSKSVKRHPDLVNANNGSSQSCTTPTAVLAVFDSARGHVVGPHGKDGLLYAKIISAHSENRATATSIEGFSFLFFLSFFLRFFFNSHQRKPHAAHSPHGLSRQLIPFVCSAAAKCCLTRFR